MCNDKEPIIGTQSPKGICSVTGYDLLHLPGWKNVQLDESYSNSITLIDGHIILSRPEGYVTLAGIKSFISLVDEIIQIHIGKNTPFFIIEDFTQCKGATTEARRHFIKIMKRQNQLAGLIFYGASPLFKISIKLGKRFYKGPGSIDIANNYSEAVHLAKKLSKQSFHKPTEIAQPAWQQPPSIKNNASADNKEWSKQLDGFKIQFSNIDSNILYANAQGFLKEEYVQYITQLREKAARTINPDGTVDYTISEVTQLTGATHRARMAYMRSLKEWSQNQPFKMFVYVGAKRFLRTAINLARPLMPFKVRVAEDLDGALAIIHDDRQQTSPTLDSAKSERTASNLDSDIIQPDVQELLGYLGAIDWEAGSSEQEHNVKKSHPLFPIYEAVKLIKDELNQLFDEKNRAEIKLQNVNADLENHVRKRTAQLEHVNRELVSEIKERQQTVIKLRHAKLTAENASQAKSEFLANMSHELRTPLNHIIGFTEIVLDQHFGPLNDRQTEHLQDVTSSSQHLLSLINDILDLSKVEAGKLKLHCAPVHLHELLEESLKMVQEKTSAHRIIVHLNMNNAPATIEADNRKLRQILYNLLSNAVKFTPDGGDIRVDACLHSSTPMSSQNSAPPSMATSQGNPISTFKTDDEKIVSWFNGQTTPLVEIAVTDTGIGIKPKDLNRIFSAFEQADGSSSRRYQGTGLGLSLTQKLVELHGGRIWAESQGEGFGSIFRTLIPLNQPSSSIQLTNPK